MAPTKIPSLRRAVAQAAGLLCAGIVCSSPPAIGLAQGAASAQAGAAQPSVDLNLDCTTVSDPTERLNCWDAHARATAVQKKAADKRLFGLSARQTAAATTARRPKPVRRARAKPVRQARAEDDGRRVVLTLASVGAAPDGRLLLTSTDGAVWEQTDSDTIREMPRPGSSITIRRGPLGGYMCDVTRWQPVRCKRDQ